jgi:hypothetical protein
MIKPYDGLSGKHSSSTQRLQSGESSIGPITNWGYLPDIRLTELAVRQQPARPKTP